MSRSPGGTSYAATPLVRQLAARHGIDLDTVKGSGVAGRVTADDVRRRMPAPLAAAAPLPARPTLAVRMRSFWAGTDQTQVTLDVYALNPLADDLRQVDPARYAAAVQAAGAPPTLFATGDLPLITTSGNEPALLQQLPYVARHAAASASTADLGELLEAYAPPSQETWMYALQQHCLDQGVLLYERRMQGWAAAADV